MVVAPLVHDAEAARGSQALDRTRMISLRPVEQSCGRWGTRPGRGRTCLVDTVNESEREQDEATAALLEEGLARVPSAGAGGGAATEAPAETRQSSGRSAAPSTSSKRAGLSRPCRSQGSVRAA